MISNSGTTSLGLYDFKRQIDAFGGVDYFRPSLAGGYLPNARVMLNNGEIVQNSTNGNLTNDPNTDMAGWFNESKQQRELAKKAYRDNQTIYDYGAVGDGTLHTVEEWYLVGSVNYRGYANLAAVQADYPFVTDKDFSCDQAAILKLASLTSTNGFVNLSKGHFIVKPVNDGACLNSPPVMYRGLKGDTLLEMLSDPTPAPNTTVWWDMFLFTGVDNSGGGVSDIRVIQNGGARNNCGVIAIRGGANNKDVHGVIFESAIASCVISEYDAENPIVLNNKIFENDFKQSARHQVYVSGTLGDAIFENRFAGYEREAIIIRGAAPDIHDNNFKGDASNTTRACITLAKRSDGSAYPTYRGVKIKNNKASNLYTAFYDGNGQSCHLEDSEISGNEVRQVDDPSVTQHVFMFYVSNRNNLRNNKVFGARRRGFSLGGCSDNDLTGTTLIDVNGAGEAAGSIHLTSYTDFDNVSYPCLRNNLSTITAIDNRPVKKQYSGIYVNASCINNKISKPNISGFTGAAIALVDGIKSQKIGDIVQDILYTKASFPTGTNSAASMTIGGNSLPAPVSRSGYVSRIRIDLSQQTLSGTITCRLLKNGATFTNVVFTANGTSRNNETYFLIDQLKVETGDTLTATIESSSITSGLSNLDVSFSILLCD